MTKPTAPAPKDPTPPRGRPEHFGTGAGNQTGGVISRRVGKDGKTAKVRRNKGT
jgi:hypothetical protein